MNSEGWSESGTIRSSDHSRHSPFRFPPFSRASRDILLAYIQFLVHHRVSRHRGRRMMNRRVVPQKCRNGGTEDGTPSLSLSSDLEMRIRSRLKRFSAACSRPLLISRVSSQPIAFTTGGINPHAADTPARGREWKRLGVARGEQREHAAEYRRQRGRISRL